MDPTQVGPVDRSGADEFDRFEAAHCDGVLDGPSHLLGLDDGIEGEALGAGVDGDEDGVGRRDGHGDLLRWLGPDRLGRSPVRRRVTEV